jgi:DNA-binding NarL/FixJ family response regulator
MSIRIVLVDDHPLVLKGLEQLLGAGSEFEVVAKCGTAASGLATTQSLKPDVVVLDLALPDANGLTVVQSLGVNVPPAVVVLTASESEEELLTAVQLGARGVVLKEMAPSVLEDCIRTVHAGKKWLTVEDIDLTERVAQRNSVESELGAVLTPREVEIVRLASMRLENDQIAARLGISVGTVKIHLHHIYSKLRLRGREDLQEYLRAKDY